MCPRATLNWAAGWILCVFKTDQEQFQDCLTLKVIPDNSNCLLLLSTWPDTQNTRNFKNGLYSRNTMTSQICTPLDKQERDCDAGSKNNSEKKDEK